MPLITILQDKRIILAVTGSIAVYKSVDLASKLTQAGALVDVIMTESAQRFVTPLTFQSVTGRPVYTDLWQGASGDSLPTHIAHVGLGENADLLAVVPITANSIAKLAAGLADDLLSVTALAARCPLLIAPAMDGGMYEHPATQANLRTLLDRGAILVEPEEGRFASGLTGRGRLPNTDTLMGEVRRTLGRKGSLKGQRIAITAGGTREPLDPVRFISNYSSGKQGYALAQAAVDAGADEVILISAVNLPVPVGVKLVPVESAVEILIAIQGQGALDALIMAAAVADFRPASRAEQKIKKDADDDSAPTIELVRNPDILKTIHKSGNKPRVVVGFAAESENLLENAQGKLERKGLDMIVANDISASDAGFASDDNRVVILSKDQAPEELPLMSKALVSERIIRRIAEML